MFEFEDAPATVARTIVPGPAARSAAVQDYHRLQEGPGETPVLRSNEDRTAAEASRSLLYFAHLTDIQLADTQSTGRLEMLHQFAGSEQTRLLLPAARPQELLAAHATDALAQAIRGLAVSPISGAPMALTLTTGDMIDNAQWNETLAFLALLSGGTFALDSGGPEYEGTQDGVRDWMWAPEDAGSRWGADHGYPVVPGYLGAALRPFRADGLGMPWLACFGNHDGLIQGRVGAGAAVQRHLIGDRKPVGVPEGAIGDFVSDPMHLLGGGAQQRVTPDPDRRAISRGDFVEAHFHDGGAPFGHGFDERNRRTGTAYYAYDAGPEVRIIVLDTTNPAGNFEGSLDRDQFAWLEQELIAVHQRYRDPSGQWHERPENEERLVVIASHHPRWSMTNATVGPGRESEERILGEQLGDLLEGFPNVVVWISGHVHRHSIRARSAAPGSYWEITTASVMEWPSQIRLLEILENSDGTVSLVSLVADHAGQIAPEGLDTPVELAAWHRELAYNDPSSVGGRDARGEHGDRNVVVVLPDPRLSRRRVRA